MLEVVREFNPTISQQTTKQQLYRLLDNQRVNRLEQKKASAEVQAQQSITDPFTFEYLKDPVFASDGGIYNRSTVQRLLAEMGMKYNSNRQLVPNYPRTARGIIDKYQTIQELQRTNPVKAQQLKQIRRKALEAQQV
jgi:hypothetical protein